jgi:bla regulator protein blaR1
MQGPDLISILMTGLVKPLILISLISVLFLFLRRRSAALKHFCLLMGMLSLLVLPVSAFLIPDTDWAFPFSHLLFQSFPFAWQEYLLKTSNVSVNPDWWQSILAIYLLVSTSIIFYLVIGFIQLWRIYARSVAVKDSETLALVEEIGRLYGVNRKVQLVSTTEIDSPCVWGLARPKILIPDSFQQWTYDQKISVFMHELGHIHRFDALSLFVVKITCAVFWFLIPVWWFAKKMTRESEMACDDLIYRLRDKQVQYAEHLLQLANHSKTNSPVTLPMSGHSEIYQRIMAVLDSKRQRHAVQAESIQYPLILGLLLVISLGALDSLRVPSLEQSFKNTSTFHWSWARLSESSFQSEEIQEAQKTLDLVDELQSRARPVMITRFIPEKQSADYSIGEEYKSQSEIDKASFRADLLSQSAKSSSAYKVVQQTEPEYPEAALKKGSAGFVRVMFDLDKSGEPQNIRILDSKPDGVFDRSVVDALKKSRFEWIEKDIPHAAIQKDFIFQLDTGRKR